ncbi:MAG TPA: hypothetical protein VK673_22025 [Chthoniobacterales bacterium]|nr:hypothetical protein [Chthoniobacterales bacterium]
MIFDPALGVNCVMTIFGLNYNASRDAGDNGIGAFENQQTGQLYRTANKTLVAVSIPIPFYEETPDLSRADIESGRATCVIQDQRGNVFGDLLIADLGPGKDGKLIRAEDGPHLLDRTWKLCWMMAQKGNPMDNVKATFWLVKDGQAYTIHGQDTPYITV